MASEDDKNRNKNWARINDLKYYFGKQSDEWIDLLLISKEKRIATDRNIYSGYSPSFCPSCKKYWSYGIHSTTRKKYIDYLDWKRIPATKIKCDNC